MRIAPLSRSWIAVGLAACAALSMLAPTRALAHGGLPVSEEILWQKNTLYVPTQYWGIFVGTDGGDWRWICDEAINQYKLRQVVQGGDGTFYATDVNGLTTSTDKGCTWTSVVGDISAFFVDTLFADPLVPTRAYATSVGTGDMNGMWRSDDSGKTWKQILTLPGQTMRGFALGPGGGIYLLTTATAAPSKPTIYVSMDNGVTFTPKMVGALPAGTVATDALLIAVDGKAPGLTYLRFQGDPDQVLVSVDVNSGTATEMLRIQDPIFGVENDASRNRLLISTGSGVYFVDGGAAAQKSGGLSRSQCTSVHGGATYACSWNYMPDQAAVARSMDGGATFQKVFQYADTTGLIDCPATSSVGMICPASWAMNAPLLGINTPPVSDGLTGVMEPPSASGCSVSGRPAAPAALGGLWAVVLLIAGRRRRAFLRGRE